jgi:hypothetical protein
LLYVVGPQDCRIVHKDIEAVLEERVPTDALPVGLITDILLNKQGRYFLGYALPVNIVYIGDDNPGTRCDKLFSGNTAQTSATARDQCTFAF